MVITRKMRTTEQRIADLRQETLMLERRRALQHYRNDTEHGLAVRTFTYLERMVRKAVKAQNNDLAQAIAQATEPLQTYLEEVAEIVPTTVD